MSVFEIKIIICAPLGPKCAPEIVPVHSPMHMYYKKLKKCAHIGRTVPKMVCPMTELCTPGAGCTVNFEHCMSNTSYYVATDPSEGQL